jgi:hypothetical protein
VLLALLVLSWTIVGRPAEPVAVATARLDVEAPSSCATRVDLATRVRERSPRVRFVDAGDVLAIRARFSPQVSGGVVAELTLTRAGTTPSTRRVVARSCAEAADALALMIAVTLDPTAADQRFAAGSAGTANGAAGEGPKGNATDDARPTDATRPGEPNGSTLAASPKGGPASGQEPAGESEPSPSLPSHPRFGATLAFQSFFGPAPGVLPGVAVYAMAGVDRPATWSPVALIGGSHTWRSGIEEQGGTASFMLDAASFDACPFRFRLPRLELRPCGSVLVGRLAVEATDTLNPAQDVVRPFWVVGGAALATVPVPGPVEASLRLGIGANLVRDSFAFTPNTFHEVPSVSVAASVGAGVRLP